MDRVREEFVRAARLAAEAGFDLLQLHLGHGYLLASFLSPLANIRSDEYGGTLKKPLRFPLNGFPAETARQAAPPATRLPPNHTPNVIGSRKLSQVHAALTSSSTR